MLWPPVTVAEPAPGAVIVEHDVEVTMRDGTVLRVNVHRPPEGGPFPVLMSAHPYGKDKLPRRRFGRWRVSFQYRVMNQPTPIHHSSLTSWEAPDPAWWVSQGYVVINADLRGAGASDGIGSLLSYQEAGDIVDLVEWAGAQPWSTGSVGLLGVSYLAMSQYKVAALNPPSLKAICPWEGMTDAYRDLMSPGGVYEDGFASIWAAGTRRVARLQPDLVTERRARPLRDQWWQSLVADLSAITVPTLLCTSFSDNNCHSRGSFRAFDAISSTDKYAYSHRGAKWGTFYGAHARRTQLNFFERYLRGSPAEPLPRLRLEVRESRDRVVAVRDESEWPLARTQWRALFLGPGGGLTPGESRSAGAVTFDTRRHAAAFSYPVPADLELTGPMAARLWVSVRAADDINLFVGVEKWRKDRRVDFHGSYGYGRDRVTTGWLKASLRELDSGASTDAEPVHTLAKRELLRPGEVVAVDIALGPSATVFRAGESLRLVVAGRWLAPRNPFAGQFPAHYRRCPADRCTLHWGPDRPARLLVPVIPA
jgi:predicted acyl esterase